jgi:uncharacterized membrane protein
MLTEKVNNIGGQKMENENKEPNRQTETTDLTVSLRDYLLSNSSYWYWFIIILSCLTALLVFTITENAIPLVYIRYVLGGIFVLFNPGYCLIKTLFPRSGIDNIERIALSIGMSIAMVSITGLLLSFTPWGIRTTPITLILLIITIIFASIAIIREYQTKTVDN